MNTWKWASWSLAIAIAAGSCQSKPFKQGEALYSFYCANCHMADGTGLAGLIPPLAGSDYLHTHRAELPCIIRWGQKGEIIVNGRKFNNEMVPIPQLTESEIANILNYVNQAWQNREPYLTLEEVKQSLKNCKPIGK